jgi:hypothetical protein
LAKPSNSVFVGIATSDAAARYLSGVQHATLDGIADGRATYTQHPGAAPAVPPSDAGIWAAQASGTGRVSLTWEPTSGSWSVLVMNSDGLAGVQARADMAATVPDLGWVAAWLLGFGAGLLAVGAVLIAVPLARASNSAGRSRRDREPGHW